MRDSIKRNLVLLLFTCIGIVVAMSGCDESLPPRNNPTVLFKGDVSSLYIYSASENDYRITVDVTNIYSETFQDTASVAGTLEIILKKDPQYHKTVSLSIANLVSTLEYDSSTSLFTIDPEKKVTFLSIWDLVDDNRVDLSTSLFQYQTDPSCPQRLKSGPETFILKGSIQLADDGGIITFGPKEVELFHVTPSYIVNKTCPPYSQ